MTTASITPPHHHYPCCSTHHKPLNQGVLLKGIGNNMGKRAFKYTGDNLLCELNRNGFTLAE
ncbi:hypothetical protein ABFY09_03635 [Marinomonas sp. 5E14-1]|uniref:hypothetical protein n=1 Tax=Marinomonas sp. 5E14-1 TaxID=3153922 RepID=UPI003266BC51